MITKGPPVRGRAVTVRVAVQLRKPHLVVDPARVSLPAAAAHVRAFVRGGRIGVLNVAGPRESPGGGGIYQDAFGLLAAALGPGPTSCDPERRFDASPGR